MKVLKKLIFYFYIKSSKKLFYRYIINTIIYSFQFFLLMIIRYYILWSKLYTIYLFIFKINIFFIKIFKKDVDLKLKNNIVKIQEIKNIKLNWKSYNQLRFNSKVLFH